MNALQKINKRAKQLQKKNPNKKYKTLQKQAGKEFREGKLKTRKKRAVGAVKKRRPAKRKAARKVVRRKAAPVKAVKKRVYKAKRTKVKAYSATRYKRISGKGKSIMPILLLGGLGVAAYLLLKKPTVPAQNYGYIPTGNPTRDNSANQILAWATAGSLAASAITKLVQSLNNSSDAQVTAAAQSPEQFAVSMLGD